MTFPVDFPPHKSQDFSSQTYTIPPFEDKTRHSVVREGDKVWEEIKEIRKRLNAALEELGEWNKLLEQLDEHKAEKISQLPKEIADSFKRKLDKKLIVRI